MEKAASLLGPSLVIRGTVRTDEPRLVVMGKVTGTIEQEQTLELQEQGHLEGSAKAHDIEIHGTVTGNLYGIERTRIHAGGFVRGEIHSKVFSVEEGAKIKGEVVMEMNADSVTRAYAGDHERQPEIILSEP